ncbi:MAG: hypothetical protein RR980_00620 [Mucinivorans sp.]
MIIKKVLPHVVALVIFAAVSMLFFYPQFQGKALEQGDMVRAGGMAVDVTEHMAKYDEHPQWMGRMFGGMPSYTTTINSQGRYIGNNMHYLNILGQPSSMLFLAMAGFYLMLLMFGVNAWLAIIGGLAYGLSTYFPIIIGAGHITKMWALQWVAPMIGSMWWAYRKNLWTGAALLGIFASLEIAAYHPQIAYYFLFVVIALFVNEFVRSYKEKVLRGFAFRTAVILGVAILAVGSNFVSLYYTASYTKDSTRGPSELTHQTLGTDGAAQQSSGLDKDYATQWSYGVGETFNTFIPNLYGGGRDFQEGGEVDQVLKKYNVPKDFYANLPSYHGSQPFTEGPVYIGAVMIFLALFGFMVLSGRQKWWIVAPMLLAIMLAWGKNMMWLTDFFLDYVPLYNKFRTVSMILVVMEWAIPFLAIYGLQKAINQANQNPLIQPLIQKKLFLSTAIAGGVALLAAVVLPSAMSFTAPSDAAMKLPDEVLGAMEVERATLLSADAWRTLLLVVLSAGALWLYFKGKVKVHLLYIVLGVLVVVDMFGVDRRYIAPSDFMTVRAAREVVPNENDKLILADTTNYRVANFGSGNPFAEATTSRFHRSIGGYNAAKMRRYQELIDHQLSKMNMSTYNMLNAKYFITEQGVQVNGSALGNGWFVDTVRVVASADEEMAALDTLHPATTAVIDRRFENQSNGERTLVGDSAAYVKLIDYRVNRLTYNVKTNEPRLAVFSEIYYPGWVPYIDGEEALPLRVDYVLRAVEIPRGEHQVVWRFAAPHFAVVSGVTRVCSILLLVGALAALVAAVVRRKNVNAR